MDYWAYFFPAAPATQELLLARLAELPFESFEETPAALIAYVPASSQTADLVAAATAATADWGVVPQLELIPGQNWNALWESNFAPVTVGDFCHIRADFHPPNQEVKWEVRIQPRMAFGTGHHETTFMMLQLMAGLAWSGKTVLDFGTGTGILAIVAALEGASRIDAIDIEAPAIENTRDNARVNGVENRLWVAEGGLEAVTGRTYDFILANINRNVILASLPALSAMLLPAGQILISGVLQADRAGLLAALGEQGWQLEKTLTRGDWLALQLQHNP